MIADSLTNPPRSLSEYAEELRDYLAWLRDQPPDGESTRRINETHVRLLAVEREINWRMGI